MINVNSKMQCAKICLKECQISENISKCRKSRQVLHVVLTSTIFSFLHIMKYYQIFYCVLGIFLFRLIHFLFKNKSLKPNTQNMVNSWVKQDEIHAVAVWKTNRFFWCMDNVLLEEITIFEYLQIYKTYLGKVLRV